MNTSLDPNLLPVGIVSCDNQARVTYLNQRMMRWLDLQDPVEAVGRMLQDFLTPSGQSRFHRTVLPRLMAEGGVEEVSIELCAVSGERIRVHLSATVERADDGAPDALHFVCQDATTRYLYEQEVLNQRRTSDAFAAVFKASPDVIMSVDSDLVVRAWNDAAERLLGYSAEEAIGRHNHELFVPEDHKRELFDLHDSIRNGGSATVETIRRHKDGSLIPIELHVAGYFDEQGAYAGAIGILRDIRARKESEALIETLNREVLHRTKNLLAVVQGIAAMTVRHSQPDDFMTDFSQRLGGLSRSLNILVERNWRSIDLKELIEQQLSYLKPEHSSRLTIEGPDVPIGAGMAEPIGMAFFELSTNAVKYGALKHREGRIFVTWEVRSLQDGEHLRILWSETGVPNICPPSEVGFGSALTGRLLQAATGGAVDVTYAVGGLQWRFNAPLDGLS